MRRSQNSFEIDNELTLIELIVEKISLMVSDICDDCDREVKDLNSAALFASRKNSFATKAAIGFDYAGEILQHVKAVQQLLNDDEPTTEPNTDFSKHTNPPQENPDTEEPIQTQPLATEIIHDLKMESQLRATICRWILDADTFHEEELNRILDVIYELIDNKEVFTLKNLVVAKVQAIDSTKQLETIHGFIRGTLGEK